VLRALPSVEAQNRTVPFPAACCCPYRLLPASRVCNPTRSPAATEVL